MKEALVPAAAAALAVDWCAPWFRAVAGEGEGVARRWQSSGSLPQALCESPGVPVRFVVQEALPPGDAYEAFIRRTGTCPTRENLHDFFNGLCWLAFPQSKRELNRIQSEEIERAGVGPVRGRVRDAATLFDENGALLHAPQEIWEALLARDWRRLFVELRPLWPRAQVTVFGHALLEKMVRPRKDLTAHVWCAPMAADAAACDAALAPQLTAERLASKPFTPLPLLGVPGWCRGNENFSFYDDSHVFRPPGHKNQVQQSRTAPRLN